MTSRTAITRIANRVRTAVRPLVTVTPPPQHVRMDRDVEVPMRDGAILRVNVFQPESAGQYPVLMSAHPYGKDNLPKPRGRGRGFRPPFQARLIPQSEPYTISAWTSWEAPDPGFWVPRGYVLVNADLRGWGRSDGVGTLLSEQEADDYHDLIEWAGDQPWSNGRVGLSGVSYLALSQWGAAATRPSRLAAICPWEGFTDAYRDLMRPGGVREDGFVVMWARGLRRQRRSPVPIRAEQKRRPLLDDWWRERLQPLEEVEVPALVCGSFSDHNLHSGGSVRGFERIGSRQKWLYTHRGPKWSTYYGRAASDFQARFFDHFLRDDDTGIDRQPPVRLEVREDATTVVDVRGEDDWPLSRTEWRRVPLAGRSDRIVFDTRSGSARFPHRFDEDTEITGPMALRIHLRLDGADDMAVFAGVRKRRAGRVVGFEGSYGFTHALVTCGWLKVSHRAIDVERSLPWAPFHPHTRAVPLRPSDVASLDIGLLPSATLFRAGEELEVIVQGRWFFPFNPLVGQFPARYERSPRARCTVLCGGEHDSSLLVPVVPGT